MRGRRATCQEVTGLVEALPLQTESACNSLDCAHYGAIILVVALVDFHHPSAVVLARFHPDLFAGVLLLAVGGFYTFWFWPGRRK